MSNSGLKIVFAGTPDIAATVLRQLLDAGEEVVAVYKQPIRPAGRGQKLTPSPVKDIALAHGLPLFQPQSLKSVAEQQQLAAIAPDLMVVVAYGLILPEAVLSIPHYGCVNIHVSLLPRWRGAAPVQQAIIHGDEKTGVTIMQMDAGLDTGSILGVKEVSIARDETSASLYQKISPLGGYALLEILPKIAAGTVQPYSQDEAQATYAKKLTKETGHINWQQSGEELHCLVRGCIPWPVATFILDEERIRVWQVAIIEDPEQEKELFFKFKQRLVDPSEAIAPGTILSVEKQGIVVQTGKGLLALQELQFPGKRRMDAAAILNGKAELFSPGTQLG